MMTGKQIAAGMLMLILIAALLAACSGGTLSSPASVTPTTPASTTVATLVATTGSDLSQYQLAYRLWSDFPDIFWCDPDFFPVAREGAEQAGALAQFPAIEANGAELSAILGFLKLSAKPQYTDEEKLSIYREHKKLTRAITLELAGGQYKFSLRKGQGQGFYIEGTIDMQGNIKILKQESSFNTCPICLSGSTLIATSGGQVEVQNLSAGSLVWTLDLLGKPTAVQVVSTSSTRVPVSFQLVKIELEDGRSVTASAGHPAADLRPLGSFNIGDVLDGSRVVSIEWVTDEMGFTFDILPDGPTGLYLANGIWLKSTLHGE